MHDARRVGLGIGAVGRTIAHAADDALQNAGKTEAVIGEIIVQLRQAIAAGMFAIHRHVFVHGRDTPGLEVINRHDRTARRITRRHHPVHQVVGEVGQRITQRGKLPVQHRDHARLGRVQHHIVEPVVAMHDCGLVARRDVLRQPFDQLFHLRNVDRLGGLVLFGPAMDLAGHIVAFLAEAFEAGFLPVDIVQVRKGLHLRLVDRHAFSRLALGQRAIPQDAAFHHVHHVEHRADHRLVLAQAIRTGDGIAERPERRDHPELPIHSMRAGQQLAWRLAAHHIFLVRGDQLIGRPAPLQSCPRLKPPWRAPCFGKLRVAPKPLPHRTSRHRPSWNRINHWRYKPRSSGGWRPNSLNWNSQKMNLCTRISSTHSMVKVNTVWTWRPGRCSGRILWI